MTDSEQPSFLAELAARRRFGMKPGLDAIRTLCAVLGDPQLSVPAVHVAGTNGKGAVCAMLDACLRETGLRVGRYTSPHLVALNERFFLDGRPVSDNVLEDCSARVSAAVSSSPAADLTFFEVLTAVAFLLYARERVDALVLETGLGGRLDATNVCAPILTVITRIGLDHCDWLGDTVEKIAAEKAGIIKPGVPVVLGRNVDSVVAVVKARADAVGAPFFYAPDLASETEIPADFSLAGTFNRENAVTALAALKVLSSRLPRFSSPVPRPPSPVPSPASLAAGFAHVVWPGRFQRVGRFLVDGAHNPPAARALASALAEQGLRDLTLVCGFCGDKDVAETLRILKPHIARALAVKTNNPRSLSPEDLAGRLVSVGIPAEPCASLAAAIGRADDASGRTVLVCGSLFLAGEALVALGAYPWPLTRFDPSESLNRGGL